MKIALYTLGCKLNQAETEELKEKIREKKILIVDFREKADLYIINSCSVTQTATRKTRQIINKASRRGPVWLIGCIDKNEISSNLKIIKNKDDLIKFLRKEKIKHEEGKGFNYQASQNIRKNYFSRTRALIKIQTGCDNFCSFCIIPHFRGLPQSLSLTEIINRIKSKEQEGHQEIILTGTNINKYQYKNYNLNQLVLKILEKTTIPRIRFGSLDPSLVDEKFLKLFKNHRLLPHLHLSLQSGSDKILEIMKRKYTSKEYLKLTQRIKKLRPDFSLTTDVIVGFPEEEASDFQKTCCLTQKIGFLKIHVFPYSPRRQTLAFQFKKQIPDQLKKERANKLKKISTKLQKNFQKKCLNKKTKVLWEGKKGNYWLGFTENYLKVKTKSQKIISNQITDLIIKKENLISQ